MGLEKNVRVRPMLNMLSQLNEQKRCGTSSYKFSLTLEHLPEIKVKYIHRGDGGIGRRNGLKIRR